MTVSDAIELEAFYPYGHGQREMFAVRAPFSMSAEAAELVGRTVRIGGSFYAVRGVARQITGPIHKGEPIGIEIRELPSDSPDDAGQRSRM